MISDTFGRPVRSMRLSVTAKCDLSCSYCHNEGQVDPGREMSVEEIDRLLEIAHLSGINKVKLTGGEPLIRTDIIDIVRVASKWMEEVSMTTNGTHLASLSSELKSAGLKRVNISLDSHDADKYKEATGFDKLHDVLEGIRMAVEAGLEPVKVNIVANILKFKLIGEIKAGDSVDNIKLLPGEAIRIFTF